MSFYEDYFITIAPILLVSSCFLTSIYYSCIGLKESERRRRHLNIKLEKEYSLPKLEKIEENKIYEEPELPSYSEILNKN
tara:strand:+ start:179 stop:418 length:240 start_codon:yes stop_codon:yes gene_type:complete